MADEFNFVEDISWGDIAVEAGESLADGQSIGWVPNEPTTFAARLKGGKLLLWENGEVSVLSAKQFAERQLTHGSIEFP